MMSSAVFVFAGFATLSVLVALVSGMRRRFALYLACTYIIAVPAAVFVCLDIFILRTRWWEWFVFVAQMGLPLLLAVSFVRSVVVREYYSARRGDAA
jgi:hypothetical protein